MNKEERKEIKKNVENTIDEVKKDSWSDMSEEEINKILYVALPYSECEVLEKRENNNRIAPPMRVKEYNKINIVELKYKIK